MDNALRMEVLKAATCLFLQLAGRIGGADRDAYLETDSGDLLFGNDRVIREGDVAGAVADEDDVELTEFSDEIEEWVIEEFAKIGLDTAKSILKQEVEDLVRRTDLEEETILDVMKILKEEFDS